MIVLDRSTLITYLVATTGAGGPKSKLVILPDSISIKSFSYLAPVKGLSLKDTETVTIDDLAFRILDPDASQSMRIVNRRILGQLILKAVREVPDPSLSPLKTLPLESEEAQESIVAEFDEYLRCVDVGRLVPELLEVAGKIPDPFHSKSSTTSVNAFSTLEKVLTSMLRSLGSTVFLSRSHLVRQATESLATSWPDVLNVAEILIGNISVLDAPTIAFLDAIAKRGEANNTTFEVHIFQGAGTYSGLRDRLANSGIEFREATTGVASPPATKDDLLTDFAGRHKLKLVALPDRRREVEETAREVRELLRAGTHPSDLLLVARDSGKYLPYVEEIFPAYGIPYYVQTRRPFAHLSPYRFVKATLDLIVAARRGVIQWDQITDPLRLGFCLPGGSSSWPLASRYFIYLEESLPWVQKKLKGKLTLADWASAITDLKFAYPRDLLQKFLQWVNARVASPPKDAEGPRQVIASLLGSYMFQESVWTQRVISPSVFQPERILPLGLHPTRFAGRIRGSLGEFVDHFNDYVNAFGRAPDWALADQVFGETFGSETYGLPDQDLAAVKLVDAGTVTFAAVKHLFVLGLKSEEFPRKTPQGVFLPEALRDSLDEPGKQLSALLYLRSALNDYSNEYDYLEAIIQTGAESITATMPYLDEKGNLCEWSPFVEKLVPAKMAKRVRPDEWLPVSKVGNWASLVESASPWVRERLYLYHSRRKFPRAPPEVAADDVAAMAIGVEREKYTSELAGRLSRYLEPPKLIQVQSGESWFTGTSLTAIAGPPFHAHELDLHGTCPLQFYFFQYLFNWGGLSLDRNRIPPYRKTRDWRYGRLPRRLSYYYPSTFTLGKIGDVIANEFPDRQGSLSTVSSLQDLRTRLSTKLNDFDLTQLAETFDDDRSLVTQELRNSITREWSWVTGGQSFEVGTTAKVSFVVPPHRVDSLQNSILILTYVNFSRQIEKRNGSIYYGKTRRGIERASDPLKDYRIAILLAYHSQRDKVAGATFAELFDGGRKGYYNQAFLGKHKGPTGFDEELEMAARIPWQSQRQILTPVEWRERLSQFQALLYQRGRLMTPKPDVEYTATPSEETCSKCVYSDLCQVPRSEGLL